MTITQKLVTFPPVAYDASATLVCGVRFLLYLLFFEKSYFSGTKRKFPLMIGSNLSTGIDNLGQIGDSLGYPMKTTNLFVSLVSIWNYFGRIFACRKVKGKVLLKSEADLGASSRKPFSSPGVHQVRRFVVGGPKLMMQWSLLKFQNMRCDLNLATSSAQVNESAGASGVVHSSDNNPPTSSGQVTWLLSIYEGR
ncbi:hypothetical protein POM88_053009 [Heracleum sosnowskyi]|uniref:Uncharacterized protein n=1 Tax=Heracleum sosnowskyi TaxID=360622 RepID=A0AAD8GSC7_9APIA|nr:hypothetical protein POM88_053009 [Heracleum sosnowskyi]